MVARYAVNERGVAHVRNLRYAFVYGDVRRVHRAASELLQHLDDTRA